MKTSDNKNNKNGKTIVSLLCCVAMLFGVAVFARQSLSTGATLPNTGTNVFPSTGGLLQTVTVNNTNSGPLTVNIYDAPTNKVTYTNAAVTNYTFTTTTTNLIYTNVLGQVQTNTFTTSIQSANTIAANTNNYPLIATIIVPPTNSVTWDAKGVRFVNGLLMTNTTPGTGGVTFVVDGFGN